MINYKEENSTFSPVFELVPVLSLTTYATEIFQFDSNFNHPYPNIIKNIEFLKMFQTNKNIVIRTSDNDSPQKKKKKTNKQD